MSGWGTIIGTTLGFTASVAPDLLGMVKDHFTHVRTIEAKQQELDAAKDGWEYTVNAHERTITEQQSKIEQLTAEVSVKTDHSMLHFFRSSVRPTLTYAFFILFAVIKIVSLYHAYHVEHLSTVQALPVLWDDETETLFSAVISFWFGTRALSFAKGSNGVNVSGKADLSGSSKVIGE